MLLLEEGNQENGYIQQRGEAIEGIERTIAELGGIFGQLAQMVSEQSDMIQRIDANTEDIVDNVEGAQRELMKYWSRVQGNRWLVAKMFGVLMICKFLFSTFLPFFSFLLMWIHSLFVMGAHCRLMRDHIDLSLAKVYHGSASLLVQSNCSNSVLQWQGLHQNETGRHPLRSILVLTYIFSSSRLFFLVIILFSLPTLCSRGQCGGVVSVSFRLLLHDLFHLFRCLVSFLDCSNRCHVLCGERAIRCRVC
jgi:hypothetical protein